MYSCECFMDADREEKRFSSMLFVSIATKTIDPHFLSWSRERWWYQIRESVGSVFVHGMNGYLILS